MPSTEYVEFSLRAGTGEIQLRRPEMLNALNLAMVEAIDGRLAEWADDPKVTGIVIRGKGDQAFCAGIDQRALYETLRAGDRAYGRDFFRRFYQLLYRLAHYRKPTVAIMNGATMSGGVALAMHCRTRVATRNTYLGIAECRIGFFADGGAGVYLDRCPGELGMFLAMTGTALRGRGLVYAGLATHLVPEDQIHMITPRIVDPLAIQPPSAPLAEIEPNVNQIFGLSNPKEILGILSVRSGKWANDTIDLLRQHSPTSLAVTYRHLRASKGVALEETLKMDYRLSQRLLDGHDFPEGIRAHVIDRGGKPKWRPAELAGVSDADLDRLFAPLDDVPDWAPAG